MSADVAVTHETTGETSKRAFVQHYLEMVLVMVVSMALLGAMVSLIFGILGHSNFRHYPGLRASVMTGNMTIGMVVWMRFRGHGWGSTTEMAVAMVLPLILLILPYWVGLVSGSALILLMHALMFPFMLVVMLRRYDEYAQKHGRRHSGHLPPVGGRAAREQIEHRPVTAPARRSMW